MFLFYWYFARVLGRNAGLVAALVLPTSPMWLDKASAAEIDMLQVAWVTGAILCFLRALEGVEAGRWTPLPADGLRIGGANEEVGALARSAGLSTYVQAAAL